MSAGVERGPVGDGTERWHGTAGGRTNHHCYCDRCNTAISEYRAATHRRKMEARPPKTPKIPNRKVGALRVTCWCESEYVAVPAGDVRRGVTGTCGAAGCRPDGQESVA